MKFLIAEQVRRPDLEGVVQVGLDDVKMWTPMCLARFAKHQSLDNEGFHKSGVIGLVRQFRRSFASYKIFAVSPPAHHTDILSRKRCSPNPAELGAPNFTRPTWRHN